MGASDHTSTLPRTLKILLFDMLNAVSYFHFGGNETLQFVFLT